MSVELDLMEYANDAAAQAAYESSSDPASWDLLDEDCSDISDWDDADAGNGVSEVSPAGQFRMDGNTASGATNAQRNRDIGTFPNIFTVEIKVYHDKLGLLGDSDQFSFYLKKDDVTLAINFGSGGVYVYDGSSHNEVGSNLVKHTGSAEWQTWRFVVDMTVAANAVVDIYLTDSTHENEKVGNAIDCSYTGTFVNGEMFIAQYCRAVSNQLTHIDYIKIATGAYSPDLQCYSEDTIKQQGSYSLKVNAKQTGSLNDTLTRTIGSPIDLSDQTAIEFDVRASRTGSQFKIAIHDSGGTTTEHTVNIASANTWQTENWGISGVANADKDAIDEIKITILNADAENTFYIDAVYALLLTTVSPATFELALALPGPSLIYDYSVFPDTLALALTQHAPTIGFDRTIIPAVFELEATLLAPEVIKNVVAWSSGFFTLMGTTYEITAGSTKKKIIYWDSGYPTTFQTTDDIQDVLDIDGWVVCISESGMAYPAFARKVIHGGIIQAGTITAAYGQIDDLAVDTLQIADEAVTLMVAAFTAAEVGWGNDLAWHEAQTITMDLTGQPVMLIAAVQWSGLGAGGMNIRIRRDDTTTLYSTNMNSIAQFGNPFTVVIVDDDPGTGEHTYDIDLQTTDNPIPDDWIKFKNRSLVGQEVKK